MCKQEWTKFYIDLIALYVHRKNSNYLRSHLRAIIALDHSRLGLENKSGRIFGVRQVLDFTKCCQQIWVLVNQPFLYFSYITSEVKQYYEALFLSYRQDERSTRGLLAKPLKKFPKSPTRPAGSYFWQAPNLQCKL